MMMCAGDLKSKVTFSAHFVTPRKNHLLRSQVDSKHVKGEWSQQSVVDFDYADSCSFAQMFAMDINPMDTLHQRSRRDLEMERYPHLVNEIIHRDPAFCQQMCGYWQSSVLSPLAERLIPVRLARPVAFDTFGHWGPFSYVENWGGLANARFINEASMLSWLIASHHVAGNFLHSQCCVLGLFCHCLRQSIPLLQSKRKQLLWTRLHHVLQCLVCREARFEWGLSTTRQYLGMFIDRVGECLDFATFVIAPHLRELTLTQVLPMDQFCCNVRRTTLNGQLQQLMTIEELVAL